MPIAPSQVARMGRNLFLVLCLLFPIMAGMGMNFAMTLGAMGAELAIMNRQNSPTRIKVNTGIFTP